MAKLLRDASNNLLRSSTSLREDTAGCFADCCCEAKDATTYSSVTVDLSAFSNTPVASPCALNPVTGVTNIVASNSGCPATAGLEYCGTDSDGSPGDGTADFYWAEDRYPSAGAQPSWYQDCAWELQIYVYEVGTGAPGYTLQYQKLYGGDPTGTYDLVEWTGTSCWPAPPSTVDVT